MLANLALVLEKYTLELQLSTNATQLRVTCFVWLDGPIFVFSSLQNVSWYRRAVPEMYPLALSRMCWRRCCRPDFNPHARHVRDAARVGNQPAFRGPEICGVGTEEDAAERDLTPRAISNCLRHLEIKPSNRSLISSSFIKPLTVAGSPISIN